MRELIVIGLLVLGTIFIFLAAVGLLKMPDVYLRMSASTIAATLGVSSILTALAVHFFDLGIAALAFGTNVFLFLTVPVGAHLMGRAAHKANYEQWGKTLFDRLKGKYSLDNHTLHSGLEPDPDKSGKNDQTNKVV
ncbi:MAG: monovalent cation/H(+) antiporter subunit G [Bacteroidales bacterium]|nr:monovalent cation/H(+) antiporter subunit G [Bacteroidales bacterium]